MSFILDTYLRALPNQQQRFKDIAANERAMKITPHDTPSLSVVEEWRYEVDLEFSEEVL